MSGNPELVSVVPTGQGEQQCSHKHCNKRIWIHNQSCFNTSQHVYKFPPSRSKNGLISLFQRNPSFSTICFLGFKSLKFLLYFHFYATSSTHMPELQLLLQCSRGNSSHSFILMPVIISRLLPLTHSSDCLLLDPRGILTSQFFRLVDKIWNHCMWSRAEKLF